MRAPSTLTKPILLLPYCTLSSSPDSFDQHSTICTTHNKLIPFELLHSYLPPFPLYRGTIHAPRQSIGTTPTSKHRFKGLTRHYFTAILPFVKHSTGYPPRPGALYDLISFIASLRYGSYIHLFILYIYYILLLYSHLYLLTWYLPHSVRT